MTLYFETNSTDPRFNLAFEEYLLLNRTRGEVLMLWRNDNAVIIGRNQNTGAEINASFVRDHGISVVRRITGGGAVYHDLGNLNYSFITGIENADQLVITRFAAPIVNALKSLDLNAEVSGRNDILIDGLKVSGTAQRIHKGRILFHGTLLFDSDPAMIAGALNADPLKFTSKASRSVTSRVGNIRPLLKEDMTIEGFTAYLKGFLTKSGLTESRLSADELEEVTKLKKSRYDTKEWNYGVSPAYEFMNKKRFEGGILEARCSIEKGGAIKDIVFYGDFLATADMTPLTEALKGVPFFREEVEAVISMYPVSSFFGRITKEEVLEVLFG